MKTLLYPCLTEKLFENLGTAQKGSTIRIVFSFFLKNLSNQRNVLAFILASGPLLHQNKHNDQKVGLATLVYT